MRVACSSQSYDDVLREGRLTLVDWMRFAAEELGLTAVELEDKHVGELREDRLEAVAGTAARFGLTIVNIALMNNFGVADDTRRGAEQACTREWIAAAQRLGARFLRTFAGWPEGPRAARWPAMIAALRSVCREAERRGVRMVMENHNHGGFVQTAADVTAILAEVGSPALGLLLDTGNYLDGLASVKTTVARAWHVHAKFTRVGEDGRDPAIDHDAIVRLLRDAGYDGWISAEYEGAEASRTAVPRALAYLQHAVSA